MSALFIIKFGSLLATASAAAVIFSRGEDSAKANGWVYLPFTVDSNLTSCAWTTANKTTCRFDMTSKKREPCEGDRAVSFAGNMTRGDCAIAVSSFDPKEHVGDWTAIALATNGTSLGVATTLSLEESFQARLRNILKTLMQILAWVAIPDETEDAEWGRNFTMDMGNKIMDGIWDEVDDIIDKAM